MNRKRFFLFLFIFCISLISFNCLSSSKTLDHKAFLEKIKNSSDNIYNECIKEYDIYLATYPDDILVHIEKCKFIQYAQYNDEDYYNPHQAEFDSCANALITQFPNHAEVLLFQTTYLWGEELQEVFDKAKESIEKNPEAWNDTQSGELYKAISDNYYYEFDYNEAYTYIVKAISHDKQYEHSLEYIRILIETDKKEKALDILTAIPDTAKSSWELTQKADLLLELKAYEDALDIYSQIKDSLYNNNADIAATLEGIGQYEAAREYLVSDLSVKWDKELALRNLLNHDLKYQDGSKCIESYNQFRDLGYSVDPIGLYRLKLFFVHPFQPLKFRDLLGFASLWLVLVILLLVPSIWVLPVYFVGHYWKFLSRPKPYIPLWGLKVFWFVSAGYLLASFLSYIAEPEVLYSLISSSYYEDAQQFGGTQYFIFIIIMAVSGFAVMYKINPKILLSHSWSIGKSILIATAILFAYKVFTGIYMLIGIGFGISIEDVAGIPNMLLASRQDIGALTDTFGKGITFLLLAILVPVYEEIIFRGAILDSCMRYINFPVANVLQALFFSLVHNSLFLAPVFFLFGIITGIMRKRSGGLLPGIAFHVLNNALALLVLFIR